MSRDGKMTLADVSASGTGGALQFPSRFSSLEDNEITRQKAELARNAKMSAALRTRRRRCIRCRKTQRW